MQQLIARLTGKSIELISYGDVHDYLHVTDEVNRGVQEIPLDAIVGSVGRYEDFTRDFLPLRDSDEERWARVKKAVLDMKGWPPIEVYQVGDGYFVIDGNHRVSVARQIGSDTISAHVTELKTRMPLSVVDDPGRAICKAQHASFLEETQLAETRPDSDLQMTFAGYFDLMRYQISWHQKRLEAKEGRSVSVEEAAASWYDNVYLPVVELIRQQGILRHFPRRTETDIYVLLVEYRSELEEALGWEIDTRTAVSDFATHEVEQNNAVSRLLQRLRQAVVPEELEPGPEPGRWRQKQLQEGRQRRLFTDYLVAIRGTEPDWHMLHQVIQMAKRENDRLLGLHVVPHKSYLDRPEVQAIRTDFERRCREAGVTGELALEVGSTVDTIIERAAYVDLVVTRITQPPQDRPLSRLGNGFTQLVQRCPRPILAMPVGATWPMDRVLLAYDGSPKADEALFVATYLKSRWPIDLTVVTVVTEFTSPEALDRARAYIESYGIEDARYVLREKPIADAVLETAVAHDCNMLIMGGFGFRPVLHIMLGSTVERVLSEFPHPILICR